MAELTDTVTTYEKVEENVYYYYDKLGEGNYLNSFITDVKKAYEVGWQDNKVLISDTEVSELNGWTYLKGYAPKKSKEQYVEERLHELDQKTSIYENSKCDEMYVTSSLGFRVNADRRSQQNIEGLIKILGDKTTMFKDYDNEFHELGVKDLEILLTECIQNGLNLYTQKFKMQQDLSQLETIENIQNYEIRFEMLNFTR